MVCERTFSFPPFPPPLEETLERPLRPPGLSIPHFSSLFPRKIRGKEEGSTGNLINGLRLRRGRRPSGLSSLATLLFSAQRFDRLATIDIKSKCDTDCFARNQAALASAFDHLLMDAPRENGWNLYLGRFRCANTHGGRRTKKFGRPFVCVSSCLFWN